MSVEEFFAILKLTLVAQNRKRVNAQDTHQLAGVPKIDTITQPEITFSAIDHSELHQIENFI